MFHYNQKGAAKIFKDNKSALPPNAAFQKLSSQISMLRK